MEGWYSMKVDKKNASMDDRLLETLLSNAQTMRRLSLDMTLGSGMTGAHLGGGLSMIEIMDVLYTAVLRVKPDDPLWPERDRFILSKGHGTLAYYTALYCRGFVTLEELMTFKHNHTFLYGHPYYNPEKGIEFTSGSLGLGVSLGVGSALAAKRRGLDYRVFVVVGDGESNEGTIWEAAMSAAHYKLDNLFVIVDANGLQYDGCTDCVMDMGDIQRKWEAFGWQAVSVDGHDVQQLYRALTFRGDRPKAIVARTVKGKGVSFMENNALWHHSRLTQQQYDTAIAELR